MKKEMAAVDPEAMEACRKQMLKEKEYDELSMIFEMFSDSTRLKIMSVLFTREL